MRCDHFLKYYDLIIVFSVTAYDKLEIFVATMKNAGNASDGLR